MSQVVGLDMVAGMGFIGLEPGRLYKIGQSPKLKDQTASGNPLLLNSAEAPLTALTVYGWSKQDGTPSPDNPVPIVSAGSVMVESKNLFEDYGKKISVSPSSDYYISTGETDAKRIDLACYDEQMQLVTEGGLSQTGNFYLQSNGTYRLSGDLTNINSPIVTGENTKYVEFIIPSFQTGGFPNLMLNTGSTALPYEPYFTPYADPDEGEINVTVQGGNLIPELVTGYLINENGDMNDSSNYRTLKINVPAGTYTLSVSTSIKIIRTLINGIFKIVGNAVNELQPYTVTTTTAGILGLSFRVDVGGDLVPWDDSIKIMLNAGSTPLPYMPYKTPQTLTAQTPGGLPGIPVDSGGNYTDESGQQWICDEVDFKRGKYVKRVWKGVFDGSEDEAWKIYTSINLEGFYCADALPEFMKTRASLCNQLIPYDSISSDNAIRLGANNKYIYCTRSSFYDPSLEDGGLANWKAHLAAHPLEVMTYLETPIETDLSDEEIAAYKALHTYSPATTVSNDAGAWMGVGYKK